MIEAIRKYLKQLLTPFKVKAVHVTESIGHAGADGYGAAIRVRSILDRGRLSEPHVVALNFNQSKAIHDLGKREIETIKQELRAKQYMWFGSLVAFDPKHRMGLTTHYDIGKHNPLFDSSVFLKASEKIEYIARHVMEQQMDADHVYWLLLDVGNDCNTLSCISVAENALARKERRDVQPVRSVKFDSGSDTHVIDLQFNVRNDVEKDINGYSMKFRYRIEELDVAVDHVLKFFTWVNHSIPDSEWRDKPWPV